MNLTAFMIAWLTLGCAVLGLAIYRKLVANSEDENLHIGQFDGLRVVHQEQVAHRLSLVDKWGKTLTVVVIIFGVVLATAYLYQKWIESNHIAW